MSSDPKYYISRTWVVENFSKLVNYSIESPNFYVKPAELGNQYSLNFSLKMSSSEGNTDTSQYQVSFRSRCSIPTKTLYRLSVLDINGEKYHTGTFLIEPILKNIRHCHSSNHEMPYCHYTIPQSYLLDQSRWLLPDDELTILCEIEIEPIVCIPREDPRAKFDQSKFDSLSVDLSSLFESEKHSDVTLLVGVAGAPDDEVKELKAHKSILCARSAFFAAKFEGHNLTQVPDVQLKITTDFSLEAFEAFLMYLYSGKVHDLDRFAGDLFLMADKYQMDSLKRLTEQYLIDTLSISAVCRNLVMAEQCNAQDLKRACIDYIATGSNACPVMSTTEWKDTVSKNLDLMAELLRQMAIKQGFKSTDSNR